MSGVNLQVKVTGDEHLRAKFAEVTGPKARRALNERMGNQVREKVRDHLAALAASRHTTAERLGAAPSGHLEQMARAVEDSPVTADADAATLTINHPGIGRALHDVTIVPTNGAKALTIPINALAYNRRAGQWAANELFVWRSKTTGNAFLAMRQAEKTHMPLLLFLLVRSVTQKQDRTLLPTDSELEGAAVTGAALWFDEDLPGVGG